MKIKLCFPSEAIAALAGLGLKQRKSETLRWTTNHPASHYGTGVILRGKSGELLDGRTFATFAEIFGAWIEVDSARMKQRVENALVTAATQLDDRIIVMEGK